VSGATLGMPESRCGKIRTVRGRVVIAVACTLIAGAVAGPAAATVRVTAAPGTVYPGELASTTVVVTPRARCTIGVYYTARKAQARGLGPKSARTITWTWVVGPTTKPGRFPVKIDCGHSGKTQTTIRVR
jgi:hypothetical protein